MKNQPVEFAAALRELADFYEQHQGVEVPCDAGFLVCLNSRQEIADHARELGSCEKEYRDGYFSVVKRFGLIKIEWFVQRSNVCRSKIVGVRTVPAKVIPAHDEPIVEWECFDTPLLAADKTQSLPPVEEVVPSVAVGAVAQADGDGR